MLSVAPSSRWQRTRSGLVTSMSPVVAIWAAVTSPGPVAESWSRLGPSPSIFSAICFTLRMMSVTSSRTPARRREFVQHAFDLDRGDRGALKRRQQHAAQRVAERHSEAALQRLGDERGLAAHVGTRLALQRVGLLEFLPVLCVDGHVSSLALAGRLPPFEFETLGAAVAVPGGDQPFRRGGASTAARHCAGSASRRGSR